MSQIRSRFQKAAYVTISHCLKFAVLLAKTKSHIVVYFFLLFSEKMLNKFVFFLARNKIHIKLSAWDFLQAARTFDSEGQDWYHTYLMANLFTGNIPSPIKSSCFKLLLDRPSVKLWWSACRAELLRGRHSAHITGSAALLYYVAHQGKLQVLAQNTTLKVTGRGYCCFYCQVPDKNGELLYTERASA